MEGEDSDGEEGGKWQPCRAVVMEGTSYDSTRWPPRHRPGSRSWTNGRLPGVVSPDEARPGLDHPWAARGGRGYGDNPTRGSGTGYNATRGAPHPASSPSHENSSGFQNHEPRGDGTSATQGDSPPLSELCAGAVALCSLFYIRLKKERRLRDVERRRRVFLFRRSKARERLRFAVMAASRLVAGEETASDSLSGEGQGSRVWNATINQAFSRFDWMENFRMTKATFDFLCDQLRPVDAAAHRAVPMEVQLAVTLWHLGSSCDFQTMEKIFGLSRSAIRAIIRDVCEVVASALTPKLIRAPRGGALQETLQGFERRYGLAQVAGVIGTLHVAVGSPRASAAQFYNAKGWHSVVLQAVVDPDFCFWDLNVGCPGSLSDSQVLVASELYEQGTEGTLFPNATKNVNGVAVPIHLLGSRSYPLLPWLMTPVAKESGAADMELNRRFAAALALTQIAFGRLKSRWRCLVRCSDVDLPFLPILVTACCTLHNICEGRREPFEDHWLEEASEEELEQPSEVEEEDMETEGAAEQIRVALATRVRT